jgi:PAS domain S-box-containing protein
MKKKFLILIADDNRDFAGPMIEIPEGMDNAGYIGIASNYGEGYRLVPVQSPGLFLLDSNLPGKNGSYLPVKWQVSYPGDAGKKDKAFLCIGHKLFDDGGQKPGSVVSNLINVTPERKLSQKHIEKEALFNAFMQRTPNMAWVVDEDANLVFASGSFYKYFRLDEKKSLNKKIINLIPGPVTKALYEKHIQVLETGIPAELAEKVKWADGSDLIFHINIFPIGGVTSKKMVGGHAVNLADNYKAEKQLQEANDRLLMLAKATSDAIWEWDMQTGTIFRNDALMNMIGYQKDNPKGLSWWLRRIHPEDRNRVSDKVKDATERNLHSWKEEYRFKCEDGNYKHIYDKGFIVYENGLPVKMIGSLQDITNLKNLEDELMQEKLQRQKEISEMVIKVQERERARIGHELHDNVNQILATTKLFVDMLTPGSTEEKQIKEKSLEYLMAAIEEIRKLSKELVVPQLKGNGLIDSISTLIDDIHFSDVMKIKFTHHNEIDMLSPGKKITLFRIVQEQLKNILKYSKAKQAEIDIQCKDGIVQLTIKDNGIGFDSQKTQRGIGLSNIYERTRFYTGQADIKTSPGKGCILIVSIPVLD